MQRAIVERLVCPLTRAPYDLDVVRWSEDEIVEGFLVSRDRREVRPLVAGVAIVPCDLAAHLREQGNVFRRTPINDPRLARFLLGQMGSGHDVVPFADVIAHYRDLARDAPPGYDTSPHPDDAALARMLVPQGEGAAQPAFGLEIGCRTGRGTFLLNARVSRCLGVDRSLACVRRARNIAVSTEHFFLPPPKDGSSKEIPLDLEPLERAGADFAVADSAALPLADAVAEVVVLGARDGRGPWDDPRATAAEALRVLRPGGLLLWHADLMPEGAAVLPAASVEDGSWRGVRP